MGTCNPQESSQEELCMHVGYAGGIPVKEEDSFLSLFPARNMLHLLGRWS